MKVKKVKVVKFGNSRNILEMEDISISTIEEKKMSTGENKLLLLDREGCDVIATFYDYKLQCISKDIMTFIGYTFPKNEKVSIFIWV